MKRTKEKKQKTDKEAKNLKSCSACFLSAKKKDSDDDEKEKQKETLQERVCSSRKETFFSLSQRGNEHTKRTQRKSSSFQPKRQKKNHRYLAIKLTHVDTLYSLKHSHTHNVLCYPIRCCAIRSLERRFQEKRQSSVSRGGVVLVLLMFFARIVLF